VSRVRVVVVTGPRVWPRRWRQSVWGLLDWQRARLQPGDTLRLVHGAAREGVDLYAQEWADHRRAHPDGGPDVDVKPYPRLPWAAHHEDCPPGCARTVHREHGHRRNVQMLDAAEPDFALVFLLDGPPLDESRGSEGCHREVKDRRIPALVAEAWSEPPRRGPRPGRKAEPPGTLAM
jgi:hypothetical protein